jgi:hypothetical protein
MGILYYARNPETKKACELGKGHWFKLAGPDDIADCSDYDRVLRVITDEIIREPLWAKEAVEDLDYHRQIARALVALGPILEIVDDCAWNDPVGGYVIVDSRYRDD